MAIPATVEGHPGRFLRAPPIRLLRPCLRLCPLHDQRYPHR